MHELSIAKTIVDIVNGEIEKRQIAGLEEIGIRCGVLSGVDPEALSFGFDAMTADTPLSGVRLSIKRLPVLGRCRSCAREFAVPEFEFVCPACAATDIEVIQGEELDIEYLIEKDADNHEQAD
jgi:hydrogenase nickel incorporation protein HypA/HybF